MLNTYNKVIKIEDKNFNCDNSYIPKDMLKGDIKHHIYNYNGVSYYAKEVEENEDEDMLVNELIGSYLSKLINLDAVDYQIGMKNEHKLYVLSKLFYERDFDYKNPDRYDSNYLISKLKKRFLVDNLPEEYPYLRDNLLKLALLDIKMNQFDRYVESNIMIKSAKISNFTNLAPIYDFGFSYPTASSCYSEIFEIYSNYFITIRKNYESLKLLLKKYPQIYDTLYILATLDIKNALKDIENEKEILINSDIKDNIINQDKDISKVLKRLI